MPTYLPWPCRLIEITQKKAEVKFFGDNTTGSVKLDRIGHFKENSDLVKQLATKKIPNYRKAIAEVEIILKVPQHLSILNTPI